MVFLKQKGHRNYHDINIVELLFFQVDYNCNYLLGWACCIGACTRQVEIQHYQVILGKIHNRISSVTNAFPAQDTGAHLLRVVMPGTIKNLTRILKFNL